MSGLRFSLTVAALLTLLFIGACTAVSFMMDDAADSVDAAIERQDEQLENLEAMANDANEREREEAMFGDHADEVFEAEHRSGDEEQ